MAGAAMLMCSGSWALGLGAVTVHSTLNEPLRAEIELTDTGRLSSDEIIITIASYDVFDRKKLERPMLYEELTFTPKAGGGAGTLRYDISSHSLVNEPYLHFIVEARWPGGRVMREYTSLLDLPASLP